MIDILFWGFVLRFMQSTLAAAPFILAGLVITGILRRLIGRETTIKLFGGNTKRALLQAWFIGMLLPVCSLGVLPVVRELRKMGLRGGTILAFAMSAPLFNPLSVLYGLTLSNPVAILAFALCSLVVVTAVGGIWDRLFANSAEPDVEPAPVPHGIKRLLSIAVLTAREAGGGAAGYMLVGLIGVAMLGVVLPGTALQDKVNGDNPLAPLTMTAVAVPVYATPMLAMSQLGSMFQHSNSPGAAFVLLALGAGMNLGLALWMLHQYGLKRSVIWGMLLLLVVVGLAYGVDRPLFPEHARPEDHTHAFDIYCRPYDRSTTQAAQQTLTRLRENTPVFEIYALQILSALIITGLILNRVDPAGRIEIWLEQAATHEPQSSKLDIVVPPPVLGGVAILGLIATSIVGCYAYYPAPQDALDEMSVARTEALGAALTGEQEHALRWIAIYDDWSRKLEVGTFLRDWELSDYHRAKGHVLREQLDRLRHEIEDEDEEATRQLIAKLGRTQMRLRRAYEEERGSH